MKPFIFEYFSKDADLLIEVQSAHEFSLFQNESRISIDLLPARLQLRLKKEIQDRCFWEEASDFWAEQDMTYAQDDKQIQPTSSLC